MKAARTALSACACLAVACVLSSALPAQAYSRDAPTTGFVWPLSPKPRVVTRFDPPERRWGSGHRGVDLAAPEGATVRSAGRGKVVFASAINGVGAVSVEHPGGLRTTYEPVEPRVRSGQLVAAGDPIGLLVAGHPSCPVAACLHWGLKLGHGHGDQYYDPLALVAELPIRLKPLDGLPGS